MLCKPAEAASCMAVRSSILEKPTRSTAIGAGFGFENRERKRMEVVNWGSLREGKGCWGGYKIKEKMVQKSKEGSNGGLFGEFFKCEYFCMPHDGTKIKLK